MGIIRAFGCRSPKSKGAGRWDGAFVFCKHDNGCIAAVFENRMDYVNNRATYETSIMDYNKYVGDGWIPMTAEDLQATAGLNIDENTNLKPYDEWKWDGETKK